MPIRANRDVSTGCKFIHHWLSSTTILSMLYFVVILMIVVHMVDSEVDNDIKLI